jgi:hypothetical protein
VLARAATDFERQRLRGVGVEGAGKLEDPRAGHFVSGGCFSFILTHRGLVAAFRGR